MPGSSRAISGSPFLSHRHGKTPSPRPAMLCTAGTAVARALSTPPMMHSISGKTSSRPVWHPSPQHTKHDAQKGQHVLWRHSILLRRPGNGVSALMCATKVPCTHGRRMLTVGNKWRLKERQHDSGQCRCGLAGGAIYSTQCRCGLERKLRPSAMRPIDKLDEACTNADDQMMLVQHLSGDHVMS